MIVEVREISLSRVHGNMDRHLFSIQNTLSLLLFFSLLVATLVQETFVKRRVEVQIFEFLNLPDQIDVFNVVLLDI